MTKSTSKRHTALAVFTAAAGLGAQSAMAVTYDAYIASTNPVGWWGMNETSGSTTADLSGAFGASNNGAGVNLDLTLQNVGTNSLINQTGFVQYSAPNSAAYFDGNSGAGGFGNSPSAYANPTGTGPIYRYEPNGFAAEVWIKMNTDALGIDSQRVLGTREFGFGFIDGNGATRGIHFTTFAKQDYIGGSIPNDGNWHQLGFSFDGNVTAKFYVDGALNATVVGSNSGIRPALVGGANSINLTHRNVDLQHYAGFVDEAVIWGNQRTDADFEASYLAATTVIPESSTAALLGLSLFGLARRKRK